MECFTDEEITKECLQAIEDAAYPDKKDRSTICKVKFAVGRRIYRNC
jgi:hypothetical protein